MSAMASARSLRLEREGGVARLILDRPPVNVLDIATLREMEETLVALEADADAKVLVLTGAGRAFCAGVDVADHAADRVAGMLERFHAVIRRLLRLEMPVIAAVNGAALGGGCELLLACDVVLASETAKLGQPEIRLGVFPPVAAALLPGRIGPQAAADLVLSGRTIEAAEAERLGLVLRVVPAADLDQAAGRYAATLAGHSRPVLRLAKRALALGRGLGACEAIERAESLYLGDLMRLHDPHEGIAAFVEKREPVWKEA